MGTAFSFAINLLIAAARLEFEHLGTPTELNVLIERGHRHSNQAREILEDANNLPLGPRYVTMLYVGTAPKEKNPILQAADMLAYTEWQGICERPCKLDAVMFRETSRYRTARIDCIEEVIREIAKGPQEWMENKKRFGKNKPKA